MLVALMIFAGSVLFFLSHVWCLFRPAVFSTPWTPFLQEVMVGLFPEQIQLVPVEMQQYYELQYKLYRFVGPGLAAYGYGQVHYTSLPTKELDTATFIQYCVEWKRQSTLHPLLRLFWR